MRTFILTTLALCLALATQACRDSSLFPIDPSKGHKPTDSVITKLPMDQIIGQQWQLQSYGTVGGVPTPVSATENLTLTFEKGGHLGGLADCNSYGADYATGANQSLTITNIIQTEAFCGYDKWDREYLIALGEATGWEATPEALHIYYHGGGMVLHYVKAGTIKPVSPAEKRLAITDMPGVTWKLTSLETVGDAVTPGQFTLLMGEEYTLTATTAYANHLEGIANCNTYSARFATGSDFAFTVSGLGATKIYCPDDHDLDATYFAWLSAAEKAEIIVRANEIWLNISYDNGRKVLHYNLATDSGNGGSAATGLNDAYGIKWQLSALGQIGGNMEGPKTSDPNLIPWIEFSPDGTVKGSCYCSPYSGFFQEGANNALSILNITWPNTTLCPYDEFPFLNVLMTAVSYDIGGDQLIINSANNMRAVFVHK